VKVYLAGEFSGSSGDIQLRMKRRLFSYWYHHKGDQPSEEVVIAHEKYGLELFLDSGAFSAFTQKIEIKIEDYAAYYHNVAHMFSVCSSLDAIGKPERESYNNLKALEFNECAVQPVFHAREDPQWLVKYIDEGYDYIFIGGMVPETTNWLRGWLDDLFTRYLTHPDGTPRVKLHGFGLTDQQLMFRYPWASVDSTSWIFTGMFGGCVFMTPRGLRKIVFSPHSPQAKKLNAPHYRRLAPIMQQEVDRWLVPYGVTAEQCEESYIYRHQVNARTFTEMEALACERFVHRSRGLFDA
jgi:hypothetical protein